MPNSMYSWTPKWNADSINQRKRFDQPKKAIRMTKAATMRIDNDFLHLKSATEKWSPRMKQKRIQELVFGSRFNLALKQRGHNSLVAYAQLTKVSYQKVVAWSNGQRMPRPTDWQILCESLNVTESWLRGTSLLTALGRDV